MKGGWCLTPLSTIFWYSSDGKTSFVFLSIAIIKVWFGFMVFNATFNNISVIVRRSFVLLEETGVPGENHRPAASY